MKNNKVIKLHFPPHFIREYAEKMLAATKEKPNNGPAEVAMLEDMVTLIKIAESNLAPSGPEGRSSQK